jgi:hypothetical protein
MNGTANELTVQNMKKSLANAKASIEKTYKQKLWQFA